MSLVAIRQALETQLNLITPTLSTAWENVPFVPVTGVAYQQVNLVISDTKDATVSDSSYINTGFLQVLLVYPIGTSSKAAATRADLIRATFKRGLELSSSGFVVRINKAPTVAPAIIDGAFYKLPVTIYFNNFISL